MRKTPKMLKIEGRIGEPIEDYLRREYVDERMSAKKIAKKLGVGYGGVYNWLKNYGIEIRDKSEAQLPKGFTKPSKEELRRMYIDKRMSAEKIGEKFGVRRNSIFYWLKNYGIEIRDKSEAISIARLPEGFTKPSKEELERMYIDKRMSAKKIAKKLGVGYGGVYNWLKNYGIKIREKPKLPEGFTKPSKEELERMYVNECMSSVNIAKKLGTSYQSVLKWLRKYSIPLRSNRYMSNSQFRDFLKNNPPVRDLAGAFLLMNSERSDIESIILQAYNGTFKNRGELHSLLENNRYEIYDLIKEGLTNLGAYIGGYTLNDRAIIPVLIGQAVSSMTDDKVTSSLEEKVVRILRNEYSPLFNEDMQGTLKTIEGKVKESEGKVRGIYQKLYTHYREILQLQEELS